MHRPCTAERRPPTAQTQHRPHTPRPCPHASPAWSNPGHLTGHRCPWRAWLQFSEADADSNGVLSRDEFIEFASYLDAVASALGGSHVDVGCDTEPFTVAKGTGGRGQGGNSLLDDSGSANMDLFDSFDVNQDQRLDVDEAVALLQAACGCRLADVAAAATAAE